MKIRAFLCRLFGCVPTNPGFALAVQAPTSRFTEEIPMRTYEISNEEKITVPIAPKTPKGKPSSIELGTLKVESVSGTATASVADDGQHVVFVSGDDPGTSEFIVRADADLGDGVQEITEGVTLIVNSVNATNLGLGEGVIEEK